MKPAKVVYIGKDLEAMDFAENYHRWILELFAPYLGKHFVEVGAGTGSFSKLLLEKKPESLCLIEPSDLYGQLVANIPVNGHRTRIDTYNSIFAEVRNKVAETSRPDSIIYINVLEHIEDDQTELAMIYETLTQGGKCILFVPALQALYGNFDRKLGHFRRYRKAELESKCEAAGFKIIESTYFDLAGVVPWFVKYRLMGSEHLGGGAVELYDRLVVPIFKRIEALVNVPIGKNVLVIAQK